MVEVERLPKEEMIQPDPPERQGSDEGLQDFVPLADEPRVFAFSGNLAGQLPLPADRIVVAQDTALQPPGTRQRYDLDLNATFAAGGAILHRLVTFDTGDATPSVKNANLFITTGTTAITDFDDGQVGQLIMIKATANITITDNAAIVLNGGANYAMTDTDTLTLAMFDDQVWHEISRSVN